MAKEQFTGYLAAGTDYQGQLSFRGTIRVDGNFVGTITSEGKLIIGKDGKVQGTVNINELVVLGNLSGDICVAKRTVLHQSAKVTGVITTPLLTMEEGALLQGELHMGKETPKGLSVQKAHNLAAQAGSSLHAADETVKQ